MMHLLGYQYVHIRIDYSLLLKKKLKSNLKFLFNDLKYSTNSKELVLGYKRRSYRS